MIALGVDRYAVLKRRTMEELCAGLTVIGAHIERGDESLVSTYAAYCDELERRLLAGTGMAL